MRTCCCSLAGTTACDTCRNRPSDYARKRQMDKHYLDLLYEFNEMSNGRYIVEWLDDERATIHDEANKVEMSVEEVVDKLNELTKTVDRLNNLLTTEVVPNLIFLHGAIVYGEKKDFSSLIDKIEKEVQ